MATSAIHPKLGLLSGRSLVLFLGLAAAWLVLSLLPFPEDWGLRLAARAAGYLGALFMLVPYVHIVRRCFRHRNWGHARTWLRWHIGAAYLAFLFVLLHTWGRASSSLTLALQVLLWVVMVSGVVGFYGQKLLYHLLPRLVEREYGLERLGAERQRVHAQGQILLLEEFVPNWETLAKRLHEKTCELAPVFPEIFSEEEHKEFVEALRLVGRGRFEDPNKGNLKLAMAQGLHQVLGRADLDCRLPPEKRKSDDAELGALLQRPAGSLAAREVWTRNRLLLTALYPAEMERTPRIVQEFCEAALRDLARPLSVWPARGDGRLAENNYQRVRNLAGERQVPVVEGLWARLRERTMLNREYRLHQLGRLWLLFHGPAAWALLVLMFEHILMSLLYGGF